MKKITKPHETSKKIPKLIISLQKEKKIRELLEPGMENLKWKAEMLIYFIPVCLP